MVGMVPLFRECRWTPANRGEETSRSPDETSPYRARAQPVCPFMTSPDSEGKTDNAIVLATPNRVQYIGQRAITPVIGLGGPQYIADPDPGLEPFEG